MWLDGFNAFFEIKKQIELVIVRARKQGKPVLKLDFSMNKPEKLP
jgi:hypothetical protein